MAKGQDTHNPGVGAFVLNAQEGYTYVTGLEDTKAGDTAIRFNAAIEEYTVSESEKARDVMVKVVVHNPPDANKAAWYAKLVVRSRHPSVYKETLMTFPTDGGYIVYIKWTVWK